MKTDVVNELRVSNNKDSLIVWHICETMKFQIHLQTRSELCYNVLVPLTLF